MNNKMSNQEILEAWELAKFNKVSMEDFAKQIGKTRKQVDNIVYRARKNKRAINKVSDTTEGNYRYIASKTDRIKTLEQLLRACEVDLNKWKVDDKYEVGTWEMGRRGEEKNIKWKNGKIIDGYSRDSGEINIETLYRLRAVLVRRKPIAIEPVIQPVRFNFAPIKRDNYKKDKSDFSTKKILVVPDSQMGFRRDFATGKLTPFHDRKAHDIVLQIANLDNFDAVTYLGDGLDFSEWTDKFVTEPEFYHTTQPALIEYAWFLKQMKSALPEAKHDFILGNHEDRPNKLLMKHLKMAYQLKSVTELDLQEPYSIERLLGLKELGINISEKYPNGEVWHGEDVLCVHDRGLSSVPGMTASKMVKETNVTIVAGHNHRLEMAVKTVDDITGLKYISAATCGCLCHIDYRVPGHKRGQDWQQGFGIIHLEENSPRIELIPIINGRAIYNGLIINGTNYTYLSKLIRDTGYNF